MWGEIAALLFNSEMGCSDDRARSMVVLVEFPNGADKNNKLPGLSGSTAFGARGSTGSFLGLSCREEAGHDEVSGR